MQAKALPASQCLCSTRGWWKSEKLRFDLEGRFACLLVCLLAWLFCVCFVFVFVLFLCLSLCFVLFLCLVVRSFVRSSVRLSVCLSVSLFCFLWFRFVLFRFVSCRAVLVGWSVGRSVGWSVGWSVGRLVVFFPVSSPPSTTVARLWECVSLLFCKATECQPPPPRHCRESAQPAQAKQSPTSIHGLHDAPCVNGHLVRSGSVRRVGTSWHQTGTYFVQLHSMGHNQRL